MKYDESQIILLKKVSDYINDVDWFSYNYVRDWYSKIKSRPAFRPMLSDLLTGFNPPDHYSDLDF